MSNNTQTQKVHMNEAYIRTYFADNNLSLRSESLNIGKSRAYLSQMLRVKVIDKTAMLLLCHNTGMDFAKATAKEAPAQTTKSVSVGGVTPDELKELTELVVSYIQDLGKIHSDTLRELRETRAMLKEILEKHNREFHELDVYIRNSGAEARKSREAMNNTMSKTHNYLERKLEQQK